MTDYVTDFVQESNEQITELNNALLTLEREPDNDEAMENIFRIAHTLKGNCGAMGLEAASNLAHALEDVLDAVRSGPLDVSPELMDIVFDAVDELDAMIDELEATGEIETDPSATIDALRDPIDAPVIPTSIEPPTESEIDELVERFDPPEESHNGYIVRLAITPDEAVNNGPLVVEALIDAFDLIGTDPPRERIEADEYGGRFDAVFGSAVGEEAIESGLTPVDEVEAFELVNVTEQFAAVDRSVETDDPHAEATEDDELTDAEAQDLDVDELLDEFDEFDNLDEKVEEFEDDDLEAFDGMGEAGSFDDLLGEEELEAETGTVEETVDDGADQSPSTDSDSVADEGEDVDDAGAVFDELKEEVEMVGFDELQDELDELEFDEFDNEDEVDMDELLGDDVDLEDDSFLADEEPSDEAIDEMLIDEEPADAEADEPVVDNEPADAEIDEPVVDEEPADAEVDEMLVDDEPADAEVDEMLVDEETADAEVDEPVVDEEPTDAEADEPMVDDEPIDAEADEPVVDDEPADADVDELLADEDPFAAEADTDVVDETDIDTTPASDRRESVAESDDPIAEGSTADSSEPAEPDDPIDSEPVVDEPAADTVDEAGADVDGKHPDPEPQTADAIQDSDDASKPDDDFTDAVDEFASDVDEPTESAADTVDEFAADSDEATASADDAADEFAADSDEATASADDAADDFGASDETDDFGADFGSSDETDDFGADFGSSDETDDFGADFGSSDETDDFGADFGSSDETDDFGSSDETDDFGADFGASDETDDFGADEVDDTATDFDSETADASDTDLSDEPDAFADETFTSDSFDTGDNTVDSFGDDAVDTGDGDDDGITRTYDEPTFEIPDISLPEQSDEPDADEATDEIQSVRVDVEQIDSLLNLVEGLVTSRVRLRHAIDSGEDLQTLARELDDVEDLTTELQETVMDVRLVPLNTVANRLPRVVRDIAREQDKAVAFEMTGETVELDRSILDRIGDPLIHLVRNAVDHGIEPPEEREAADKPAEGTVSVSADRSSDRVQITVSDDGGGLDPDRLRSEAVDAGILTESEAAELSDDDAYDLIFHPGLSTAEEITDVSGRGVGMDVVKRTVEDFDGTIEIDSEPGAGTTVTMALPVSVAIDDILFVESGGEEFGVPIKAVVDIEPATSITHLGSTPVVTNGDDDDCPVVRLDEVLETPYSGANGDGMIVRIRDEVRSVALHCDHVHGQQEVVVKPFEGFMRDIPGLSGATVRGRGEVVNILDVTTL